MEQEPFYLEYVWYHLINYALAVVMYTLFGRAVLSWFVSPGSGNYIMRFFCLITDPVLRVFRVVTPSVMVPALVPIWVAGWIILLRVLISLVFVSQGWVALPAGVE